MFLLLIFYFSFGCNFSECFTDISTHKNFKLLPVDVCGENQDNRIVGGSKATLGQFPWMARIGYTVENCESKADFRCGGSLITERHVITAAHCVANLPTSMCKKTREFAATQIALVRLGEHAIGTDPDCDDEVCAEPVQDILVKKAIVHPKYNTPKLRHDIAILRLKKSAVFNAWVNPLCLIYGENVNKNYVNMTGLVAGWGLIDPKTRESSTELLYLKVPIVEIPICEEAFKKFSNVSKRQQICAGGILGQDSCSGDSGGPLFVIVETDLGPKYHQLGIVSFGFKRCAFKPIPAVYTNLLYYAKWILNNLTKKHKSPCFV